MGMFGTLLALDLYLELEMELELELGGILSEYFASLLDFAARCLYNSRCEGDGRMYDGSVERLQR